MPYIAVSTVVDGLLARQRTLLRYAPAASRSLTISPGLACRFSFDFSNTGTPSFDTSNLPPRDGIISTSASGHRSFTSAASLAARGS